MVKKLKIQRFNWSNAIFFSRPVRFLGYCSKSFFFFSSLVVAWQDDFSSSTIILNVLTRAAMNFQFFLALFNFSLSLSHLQQSKV